MNQPDEKPFERIVNLNIFSLSIFVRLLARGGENTFGDSVSHTGTFLAD